jgi:hypothetical protein
MNRDKLLMGSYPAFEKLKNFLENQIKLGPFLSFCNEYFGWDSNARLREVYDRITAYSESTRGHTLKWTNLSSLKITLI